MRFGTGFESTFLPAHDADCAETAGHCAQWRDDLADLLSDGCRLVRYPIRWHRIEAHEGAFDFTDSDGPLDVLREAGAEVIIDLVHHTSYPLWLHGGFADPRFGDSFRRWADAVAERYPWITSYTLFNEPFATLFLCGHEGLWPPHLSGDDGLVLLLRRVLPSVVATAREWRERFPSGRHVWVDTCEHHAGSPGGPAAYARECNDRRFVLLDLMLGRELKAGRPYLDRLLRAGGESLLGLADEGPMPIDVLGLDYYAHSEWWYDEAGGRAPSPAPRGLAAVMRDYAQRYPGLPLMVTETNLRGTPPDRAAWLRYVTSECEAAIRAGIPLEALFWFPYVDSVDWDSLLSRGDGHIDPVGIRSLSGSPGIARSRTQATSMTSAWRDAVSGVASSGLPAYALQEPAASRLVGYQLPAHVPPPIDDTRRHIPITEEPDPAMATITPARSLDYAAEEDLVVLSHLRWEWVWQRPQQLISRIAAARAERATTWFVEEPVIAEVDEPRLGIADVGPVRRVWMEVPGDASLEDPHLGFEDVDPQAYATLLADVLGDTVDAWIYTPMALDIAHRLRPRVLFHDVMDDLASFARAPKGLQLLHRRAIEEADVVTCGGRSLHRMVVQRRGSANTHLFPSGVDALHFARARSLRGGSGTPVAGYVGVIDERLDLALIGDLARALPDWEVRVVGPVAKIQAADLPVADNITYPGMAAYADLPSVMAQFSVALMPFALNEATRSISPTKTLEYLAAGLPVVSTRVPDVVADYRDVVHLADDGDSFARACQQVISHDLGRRDRAAAVLHREREWDVIASRMRSLLEGAAAQAAVGATA